MDTTQDAIDTATTQSSMNLNKVSPAPIDEETLRFNTEQTITIVSCTGSKQGRGSVEHPAVLSEAVMRVLLALKMTETGIHGWQIYHESVVHAMSSFFCSTTILILAYIMLFFGAPFNRYRHSIPCAITIIILTGFMVCSWRFGPAASRSRLVAFTFPVAWACATITMIGSFVGPLDQMPFGSLIRLVAAMAVIGLCSSMSLKTGLLFTEEPNKPRATLLQPVLQSIVSTVRLLDNFTDMSFIRVLVDERQDGCYWFGEPDRCGVYNWLLAAVGISTGGDLLVTSSMLFLGSQASKATDWRKRAVLVLHVASLCFEMGIVAVTLLSLLSKLEHPEAQGEGNTTKNNQITATVVSLVTTFATFGVTMLGAGDAIQGLKKIQKRFSAAGQAIASRMSASGARFPSRAGSVAGHKREDQYAE